MFRPGGTNWRPRTLVFSKISNKSSNINKIRARMCSHTHKSQGVWYGQRLFYLLCHVSRSSFFVATDYCFWRAGDEMNPALDRAFQILDARSWLSWRPNSGDSIPDSGTLKRLTCHKSRFPKRFKHLTCRQSRFPKRFKRLLVTSHDSRNV